MSDTTVKIELESIQRMVNQRVREIANELVDDNANIDELKADLKKLLKKPILDKANIVKAVQESAEWQVDMVIREVVNTSIFKDLVTELTDELLADDEFKADIKNLSLIHI